MRYLATHNIGNFIHPNVRASFRAAAKRWRCEYLEITDLLGEAKDPLGSKLQLYHLDVPDGAQVLHLDADMLIRDDCPEPFSICQHYFGGVPNWQNTTDDLSSWGALAKRLGLQHLEYGRDKYISGGFYLFTKGHHDHVFELAAKAALDDHPGCYEQAAVSVAIEATGTDLTLFDWGWCRVGPSVWVGEEMGDYIYHFASYLDHRPPDKLQRYESVIWQGYTT